jgi:hypothetical protein
MDLLEGGLVCGEIRSGEGWVGRRNERVRERSGTKGGRERRERNI